MKVKLISGEFCSRCHLIAPLLKTWCEKNNYEFEEKDINNVTPEEIEGVTMLPVIRFNNERKEYDDVLKEIS